MCQLSLALGLFNLALLCLIARRLDRSRRSTSLLNEEAARVVESTSRNLDRLASDLLDVTPRYRRPGSSGRPAGRAPDD